MSEGDAGHELARRLHALPRAIAPGRDPWPRIAARIASGRSGRRAFPDRVRWPLASAAALILAMGVWVVLQRESEPAGPAEPAVASVLVPGHADALHGTEIEYRAALREVRALTRVSKPHWLPQNDDAQQGWVDLRAAEEELVAALRHDPEDPFVNQRLVALRARQVHMLRQIAAAELASRRQTI